jgi:hypothetical protein
MALYDVPRRRTETRLQSFPRQRNSVSPSAGAGSISRSSAWSRPADRNNVRRSLLSNLGENFQGCHGESHAKAFLWRRDDGTSGSSSGTTSGPNGANPGPVSTGDTHLQDQARVPGLPGNKSGPVGKGTWLRRVRLVLGPERQDHSIGKRGQPQRLTIIRKAETRPPSRRRP